MVTNRGNHWKIIADKEEIRSGAKTTNSRWGKRKGWQDEEKILVEEKEGWQDEEKIFKSKGGLLN